MNPFELADTLEAINNAPDFYAYKVQIIPALKSITLKEQCGVMTKPSRFFDLKSLILDDLRG